jgi:CBS domain-containing protein
VLSFWKGTLIALVLFGMSFEGGCMKAKDIMSKGLITCTKETPIKNIAQLMIDCGCGSIPVVDSKQTMIPIGIVTDRDIVCRAVAKGETPLQATAHDVMSSPIFTIALHSEITECCKLMADNQIRRLLVIDDQGRCCGIIAQADIAANIDPGQMGEVVCEISKRTVAASAI